MSYEVWLTNDQGARLDLLDEISYMNWSKIINNVGRLRVTLPGDYGIDNLKRDYRVEVLRSPTDNSKLKLQNIYFIRRIVVRTLGGGLTTIDIFCKDANDLLMRRVVAYAAGSSEADKTDYIDDMMKAIVRENLGTLATDTDRDYTANGFSVQVDASLGTSITKAFSRRNVLDILQDLSDIARTSGTEVYFAVVPTSANTFEFRTYIDQPGRDRRYPAGDSPMIFSLKRGNLSMPELEFDYENEANYVYAGGQGEGEGREVQTAQNDTLINQSIWNRCEVFRDARNESTAAGVLSEAETLLASLRPKRRFSAALLSVKGSRFGIDWNWGDKVTVEYLNQRLDTLVRVVNVTVDQDGLETVEGRVEVEDVT